MDVKSQVSGDSLQIPPKASRLRNSITGPEESFRDSLGFGADLK